MLAVRCGFTCLPGRRALRLRCGRQPLAKLRCLRFWRPTDMSPRQAPQGPRKKLSCAFRFLPVRMGNHGVSCPRAVLPEPGKTTPSPWETSCPLIGPWRRTACSYPVNHPDNTLQTALRTAPSTYWGATTAIIAPKYPVSFLLPSPETIWLRSPSRNRASSQPRI